eukprot:UN00468
MSKNATDPTHERRNGILLTSETNEKATKSAHNITVTYKINKKTTLNHNPLFHKVVLQPQNESQSIIIMITMW